MRRTLVLAGGLAGSLGLLTAAPWHAGAAVSLAPAGVVNAGTCAFTSYTLSGTFQRLSGPATFSLSATGACVGTSSAAVVNLSFTSIGAWSCDGGAALGAGIFTPNNGPNQIVNASVTNAGGEYIVEVHSPTAVAAGQFTTLPIACDVGQTQTTVGGSGTLTFTA
ncbi:MAG: hypothetical protein JWP02_1066 [Acidimicrobiales bacterium]|nr:hypothetical protein [Acidimicrobiales bacterium]